MAYVPPPQLQRPPQKPSNHGHVLPETTALVCIGGLDLLSTVYLVGSNTAREANPLFAAILQSFGPWGFVTFKAIFLAVPLAFAEYARKRNEEFVRNALRLGIAGYLLIYAINFLRYNVH